MCETWEPDRIRTVMRDFDQLKADNAKLREELAGVRQIMADELEKQVSDYRARHIEQVGTITELESENAELREDNDRLIEAIEELHSVSLEDRLVQLENNNAKLRELCEYLWEFAKTCGADHPFLRELGIEVVDAS